MVCVSADLEVLADSESEEVTLRVWVCIEAVEVGSAVAVWDGEPSEGVCDSDGDPEVLRVLLGEAPVRVSEVLAVGGGVLVGSLPVAVIFADWVRVCEGEPPLLLTVEVVVSDLDSLSVSVRVCEPVIDSEVVAVVVGAGETVKDLVSLGLTVLLEVFDIVSLTDIVCVGEVLRLSVWETVSVAAPVMVWLSVALLDADDDSVSGAVSV